ncbi:MAG: histidinol dehydrogenase [Pelagibacteraceae bacterium]|nr:histidinol dehydrogenase [Pelagibacteraceae bacterium]
MNKILKSSDSDFLKKFHEVVNYDRSEILDVSSVVSEIIKNVRERGDAAVIEYTSKLDRNNEIQLEVSNDSIEEYIKDVPEDIKDALDLAAERIKNYHQKQLPADQSYQDENETTLGYFWRAVESVGIYVPGGTASYPSSVLMNAIPAKIAGVKDVTMVTPFTDGKINPSIMYAAKVAGVTNIYPIGGAQAIAALTFGTETIKPVNKIVGPGNIYVAEAKRQVSGTVGIDMFAGPSEVVIIADTNNEPKIIAADLIAQSEHDPSAQSILICNDESLANNVIKEVDDQISNLPRGEIARSSWDKNGYIIIAKNIDESFNLSNQLAPEHLELLIDNAESYLSKISNAGAVFLGKNTPEALGDYIAGPSHVLPTSRSAKFSSGLSVYDFLKKISLIGCTDKSLANLGEAAIKIATNEGLDGHARSIEYRLSKK